MRMTLVRKTKIISMPIANGKRTINVRLTSQRIVIKEGCS